MEDVTANKNNPLGDSSRYHPVKRLDFMMGKFKVELENDYITLYRGGSSHGMTISNKDIDSLITLLTKVKEVL